MRFAAINAAALAGFITLSLAVLALSVHLAGPLHARWHDPLILVGLMAPIMFAAGLRAWRSTQVAAALAHVLWFALAAWALINSAS